jgi:hypothetical protein
VRVKTSGPRRWALALCAGLCLGSIPSFYDLELRNTLPTAVRARELHATGPATEQRVEPGQTGVFHYMGRNLGLMGCVSVPAPPESLRGWELIDDRGRVIFIERGRLDSTHTRLDVTDASFARGRIE